MQDNLFKTGAVMDLVSNATVQVEDQVQALEDAAIRKQQVSNYKYLSKTNTIVREFTKVGRNDTCPCGSGKKYKNCCLSSGKFEKTHELSTMESADVKSGNVRLDSISKDPYNYVESED